MKVLITGASGFIGTNFIEFLLNKQKEGYELEILNIDIKPPKINKHYIFWKEIDIKNFSKLKDVFENFKPTHVLHLAAKADVLGKSIEDFPDNILGTKNVVECVKRIPTIKRFIHTSTQFVVKPGAYPKSDDFYLPYTPYGESKAESERIVRKAQLNTCWIIIRPVNVWGPWHPMFPKGLWKYISKGLYIHPGFKPVIKYYSYVENTCEQIFKLLFEVESDKVCGKVIYITDEPINNYLWMNTFSKYLRNSEVKRVPRFVWRCLAILGDFLNKIKIPFPMRSDRHFRLTVNENLPHEKTFNILGRPKVSLEEGVKKAVEWLKQEYPYLIRVNK